MSADEQLPGREVAYRLFAAEFDDATLSHTESDEERAPNYVITPSGARLNRMFVVGALTEVTSVNDDMLRARVVDPTGAFVVYAGQYQPEALAFLERIEPPAFVAVTGKARTYSPDDSDLVYTSIRPESIATVDADTRDRWIVSAAEQTVERVGTYAAATDLEATGETLEAALLEADVEHGLAAGVPLAQDHYGTTPAYLEALRELALDGARVVADERDQVGGLDRRAGESDPDAPSFGALARLSGVELEIDAVRSAEPADTAGEVSSSDAADEATVGDHGAAGEGDGSGPEDAGQPDDDSAVIDDDGAVTDTDPGTDADGEVVDDETGDADESEALGDFDATGGSDDDRSVSFDAADVDDGNTDTDPAEAEEDVAAGMYEMDDEEREQLEAEFGAEFSTGAEVEEPGEAGIDVPSSAATAESMDADSSEMDDADEAESPGDGRPVESEADTEPGTDVAEADDPEDESDADIAETDDPEDESDADADLEDVDLPALAVDTMSDLDEGDGADRDAVIETVVEKTGADAAAVEDAIDDALMGGQCYEPGDGKLKAI